MPPPVPPLNPPLTPQPAPPALQDYAIAGHAPRRIARPATVDAVQATLRQASADGDAVIAQGGRSAIATGNPPARYDLALDVTGLDTVVAHEPEDFTATVQAGVRFATLKSRLAAHGQFLPLDPPHPTTSTIGGLVARGRGGLRRGAFGEVRDWLIGCTVALSDGRLVHGGGRVVKNVSGYDLPKLFAGSWGTLGCIVEVSFKLRPLPADDETLRIPTADFAQAVRLGREITRRVMGLQAVVAMDHDTASRAGLPAQPCLLVRAAGMEPVVTALLADATRTANKTASKTASGHATASARSDSDQWQRLSDQTGPSDPTDAASAPVVLRIGCPPPALETAVQIVSAQLPSASSLAAVDGGLLSARLPAEAAPQVNAAVVTALRAALAPLGGVLTLESAPPTQIDPWGANVPGLTIMRRIKAELDPTATMSPGRFVSGL